MVTNAQMRATNKYIKNSMRRFTLQCHKEMDADIIEYLEGSGNYNKLLKEIIREKMKREK